MKSAVSTLAGMRQFFVTDFIRNMEFRGTEEDPVEPNPVVKEPLWGDLIASTQMFRYKRANDVLAKKILSHEFGTRIAIVFRSWVRSQMVDTEEFPCGGATIENYEAYTRELEEMKGEVHA